MVKGMEKRSTQWSAQKATSYLFAFEMTQAAAASVSGLMQALQAMTPQFQESNPELGLLMPGGNRFIRIRAE